MPTIQLTINLNEKLGMTSIVFNHNDTDIPSDGVLLKNVAFTLLKALSLNADSVLVQDLFSELNITVEPSKPPTP